MVSKKHRQQENARKVTLFLNNAERELLSELSEEMGIPQSQLMAFFLVTGNAGLANAKALLPRYLYPSKAARWKYNINLDQLKEDYNIE